MSDQRADAVVRASLDLAEHRGRLSLVRTALRTRSRAARDVLAAAATGERRDYAGLVAALDADGADGLVTDPEWGALTARVLAAQPLDDRDPARALALYEAVVGAAGPAALAKQDQLTWVALLLDLEPERARAALDRCLRVRGRSRALLEADLVNPFASPTPDREAWLEIYNARLLPPGAEPVVLGDPSGLGPGEEPFDLLGSAPAEQVDGPLVTVVVTAFSPDRGLLTSVESVLAQTWASLEVLVVDDASPGEYREVLDRCEALDDRVRVLRLGRNGGTYLARNAALDAARGELVTFQDSDDWSHPRRVELQARPLLADPSLPATRSSAVRSDGDLVFRKIGVEIERVIASSLMFRRREVLDRVGYFDAVRKAADTEFHLRLETALGRPTLDLPDALSVVRLRSGSLSRGEFRPGWHHPARWAYRTAYEHWHRELRSSGRPCLLPNPVVERPFPTPRRFLVEPPAQPLHYDVVLVSDWREDGEAQRSLLETAQVLHRRGSRVALSHLELLANMASRRTPTARPAQQLLNDGVVEWLLPDEQAAVGTVVVRPPAALQFPPEDAVAWQVDAVWVVADTVPDGEGVRAWCAGTCTAHAARRFGVEPLWVPQDEAVRAALAQRLPAGSVAEFDAGEFVDTRAWKLERRAPHGRRPVVGRLSRDEPGQWPATASAVAQAYPDDGSLDVRVRGSLGSLAPVMGPAWAPRTWLVYDDHDLSVRELLAQVDVLVHVDADAPAEAVPRVVVEAMAAGVVCVLPWRLRPVCGPGAVYCSPGQVVRTVHELHADPARFARQSDAARAVARERYSTPVLADRLSDRLAAAHDRHRAAERATA